MTQPHRSLAALVLAGLSLSALPLAPLRASDLRVMPVRVEVAPEKRFCALTVSNDSPRPVSIQVRGFGWSMDTAGTERLDPETGPTINPAIFTLAKGQSQLVRCSLPANQGASEGSWRLILDELPTDDTAQPGTIRSVLRISIPVFRTPAKARPTLDWRLSGSTPGDTRIILRNTGTRRIRIAALDAPGALQASGPAKLPAFGYLLAGGAWTLPLDPGAANLGSGLRIVTEDGLSELVPPASADSPAS